MDKVDKNEHNMKIDSDSNTTVEGKTLLLDLLRTEPDIIAEVFSYLELADRLNLGMTCKEMEQIHSSRPEFWQKVWLDLGKAVSSSSNPKFTRRYVHIKYHIGQHKVKQSPGDKLTGIASSIKTLQISYRYGTDGSYGTKRIKNSSQNFVEMLQLYENLEQLELNLNGSVLRKLEQYLKTESAPATAVNMKSLRHLTITIELFAILQGRIDFSSITRLKLLDITCTFNSDIDDEELQAAQRKLMDLIMQQKALEKLKLRFVGSSSIFDSPLVLGYKLKEFEIRDGDNQNSITRQDNLLDFMQSQKPELTSPKFLLGNQSSPRMIQYRANIFDLPLESQSFVVAKDSEARQLSIISNIEGMGRTDFSVSEIRQLRIDPNLVTTCVKVEANISQHGWLDFICLKFPNMKHLDVKNHNFFRTDDEENQNPLNLQSLQTLSQLKGLKISTHDICNALRDVNLQNLTEFEFVELDGWTNDGIVNFESLRELKKFINRHTKLTHLGVKLPNNRHSRNINVNYAKEANDLLHFAIENLKDLMSMEFNSVEYPCNPSNLEKTRNIIETHANIGFTLKDNSVYDGGYSCCEVTMTKTADGVKEERKGDKD